MLSSPGGRWPGAAAAALSVARGADAALILLQRRLAPRSARR
jgi:hypothetical protein